MPDVVLGVDRPFGHPRQRQAAGERIVPADQRHHAAQARVRGHQFGGTRRQLGGRIRRQRRLRRTLGNIRQTKEDSCRNNGDRQGENQIHDNFYHGKRPRRLTALLYTSLGCFNL